LELAGCVRTPCAAKEAVEEGAAMSIALRAMGLHPTRRRCKSEVF
jgi:hypothetical protein